MATAASSSLLEEHNDLVRRWVQSLQTTASARDLGIQEGFRQRYHAMITSTAWTVATDRVGTRTPPR